METGMAMWSSFMGLSGMERWCRIGAKENKA